MSPEPSEKPTIDSIVSAARARRHGETRALCEARLARFPDDADAWLWLGFANMQERRWGEAIAAFDRGLRVRAEPWALANLGYCYAKRGELDDAVYCFGLARDIQPGLTAARIGLASALHGQRRFEEALAELDAAAQLDPNERHIDLRRGCTLVELGRYDEAQLAFARTRDVSPAYPRLVAFDRETYEAVTRAATCERPWDFAAPAPLLDDASRVILVSADTHYIRRYGFAFVRSLAPHLDPRAIVHLHVYDPDASIVGEIAEAARAAGVRALAVSTETSPFGDDAPLRRKSYYACGRLLHLPAWLDHYGLPILSLDVDMVVEAPLDALYAVDGPVDLRLNARHSIDSPWLDIVANVIVAFPTAAAGAYLAAVGRYVRRYLAIETDPWLLDQTALFCVHRMMQRFAVPPRIDWMHQAERHGLWHLGHAYDYRLADPRFTKHDGRQP